MTDREIADWLLREHFRLLVLNLVLQRQLEKLRGAA